MSTSVEYFYSSGVYMYAYKPVLWIFLYNEFQDTTQLKKDLAFTKNVLKASYETKLEERACELWVMERERAMFVCV